MANVIIHSSVYSWDCPEREACITGYAMKSHCSHFISPGPIPSRPGTLSAKRLESVRSVSYQSDCHLHDQTCFKQVFWKCENILTVAFFHYCIESLDNLGCHYSQEMRTQTFHAPDRKCAFDLVECRSLTSTTLKSKTGYVCHSLSAVVIRTGDELPDVKGFLMMVNSKRDPIRFTRLSKFPSATELSLKITTEKNDWI